MGRPVSQHLEDGGPDVAEHGDDERAPGGTVVVTAIGAIGGDDGADDEFCNNEK